MKKSVIALALFALGANVNQALAEDSPWLVRARLVHIRPADQSDAISGAGAADRVSVATRTTGELDGTFFLTPYWSAELAINYPRGQEMRLDGASIGGFRALPTTLTGQYHFFPGTQINPYLGLGVTYTHFSSVSLLSGTGDLDKNSYGFALQGGVDYQLDKKWSLNLDVKKVQMHTDLSISSTKAGEIKMDPWMIGIGVGYHF